ESVAWISQRKNLLAMFFFLAALLSYVAYRRRDEQGKYTLYALSLVLFCVALLAKSVAVILPLVLICYDVCCEPRPRRGLVTDKIPFFAVAAVMAVLTIVVQSPEMGGGRTDYHGGSLLATCFTMLPVLVRYLGMLVWPANLSALYLPPIRTGIDPAVAGAFLVFIALCAAGILLFRRDRQLFFGYALFFLGLLPVSQVIPLVTLMNDRYLYFPLIGVGWLAGGIVSRLLAASSTRKRMLSRAATALVLLVLTSLSWQRATVWNNSITLWSDTVKKLPDSREAFAALAESYVNAGKSQEALRAYEEVFAFRSDFIEPIVERKALNNAAALYMDFGRFDEARPLLLTLVEKFPDYAPGFINLGYCHFVDRNLPAAEQAYRAALALEPGNTSVLMGLGNISLETRRTDAARKYYDAALANGGNGPDLQYNLACLEAATSHPAEALRHLEEALQLGYRNRDALLNNPELAPLRALPAFKRLMTTYFAGTVAP
ncbi:MAG TPA: tetratricopeptide repeat protein, partial [Geobacteraceae bacterium]